MVAESKTSPLFQFQLPTLNLEKYLQPFAPEIEREFQTSHYAHIRSTSRVTSFFLCVLFALYMVRDYADTQSLALTLSSGAPLLFFGSIFVLLAVPGFERYWQTFVVAGGVLVAMIALNGQASFMVSQRPPSELAADSFGSASLFFGQQMRMFMICLALLRLPFKTSFLLQTLLLLIGFSEFSFQIMGGILSPEQTGRFLQFTIPVTGAMVLGAWVEEQLSRSAFKANYQLAQLQEEEHRKLIKTEGMLHVLGQSVGGIVHDLGNPLTTVRTGAQTLELCLAREIKDSETLREITQYISQGTDMLDFLRLSLMEQTRVLEGKSTSVDLKPVLVQPIVEMGARFQKPLFSANREISVENGDCLIYADQMKLATVFMNLIGNALKYSDGRIQVRWQRLEAQGLLLIAVCDEGINQRGITQASASQLFTPFGRLEIHKAIEGTGLGLLSIRNVIAAHGGESWIEGYADGTTGSARFSTAEHNYPTSLCDNFSTAFVVSCPLAVS